MIKRIFHAIARSILVAAVLSGLLPLLDFTPVVQASKAEPVPQVQPGQSGKYAADHVLVKLRTPALVTAQSMGKGVTGNSKLDLTLAQSGGRSLKPLFSASKSTMKDRSGLGRIYRVNLKAGQNVEDTLALLAADPNVEYAEPDYVAQKIDAPNDPQYPTQWGLAKIQAEGAWAQTNGSPSVIIAVVDSGIDLTHEDLVDNLWVNPGEIPDNGIDDDNNGFVDDVQGWNFIAASNDLWDDNGHGTLVAGIAAARTNNGKGIAGVCGDCRIMPVKVMQPSGSANYSDIAAGINYAVVKGAKVINLSLGGYANSKSLQDAVNNALAQNIVVVAGSGNDNVSTPFYPSAYDGVISVAATDSADHKANFSNYGSWVKVSAPGVDVLTTALGGDYLLSSGTSQSGPFVSGLAGLLVTMHPDWTPAMVLGQLTHTVDGIDGLNPGFEAKLGIGRINATKALQPSFPILSYTGYSANGNANGRPDFNADATLMVSLANDWADALGVSATLTTTDSLVSVTTGTADFGDILSGQTKSNSIPYAIHIATAAGYNHAIMFTLAVTANTGAYTKTLNFTVTTRSSVEEVFGTIAEDTTWTSDKTYKFTGNVGVAPGVTLTIQPGTVVQIAGNFALNVAGTLVANGTNLRPIRFEPFTAGQTWSRVFIDDPAQDGVSGANGEYISGTSLEHVAIQGASSGLQCTNATPRISYLTVSSGGISCSLGQTPFRLSESSIIGNVNATGYSPWVTRSSMAVNRFQLSVIGYQKKVYAIGGVIDPDPNPLNTLEIYDPSLNNWSFGTVMPTPRRNMGSAEVDGKIYVVGGYQGDTYPSIALTTVEAYNVAANTWETRSSMATARGALGVAVLDGKIFAVGGSANGVELSAVEMYNPASDTWTARNSLPLPRSNLGLASVNGKLYALGGSNSITTYEYDPVNDTWIERANLPHASSEPAVAGDGRVYVIGDSPKPVDVYDPVTNIWTTLPPLNKKRNVPVSIGAIDNMIYAVGGMSGSNILNFEELRIPSTVNDYWVTDTTITGSLSLSNRTLVTGSRITGGVIVGAQSLITLSITGGVAVGTQSQVTFNTSGGISASDTATVEDNHVSGSLAISSGTAQRNQISGGNLTGGPSVLFNQNVVTGGGINAGNSSTLTGNSSENSPGVGLQAGSGSIVTGNRVIGSADHGMVATTGTISGNLVANINGDGLRAGTATIQNNTFTGIKGNGIYLNGIPALLENNNFEFNTGTYDLYNDIPAGQYTLAPHNWWGTTTTANIRSRILDFNIDYTKGRVTFSPILTGPSQTAPAYVRSLTLDPPSPVGIQTVNFTVEFSRPMDNTIDPSINFKTTTGDYWMSKASMTTARDGLAAALGNNGKIYAFGGSSFNTYYDSVEEYDSATDTWTMKASMSGARHTMGAATAPNGKIYVIGGKNNSSVLNIVEEYDPDTDTWKTKASMPTGRFALRIATASNGKIYAIGGTSMLNYGNYLSTVEEYDPVTDHWTTKANMPTARGGMGVVATKNGKIYSIGGWNGSYLATVEEYDVANNIWTTKANLPTSRQGVAAAVTSNDEIYVFGGGSSWMDAAVYEYNSKTDTWKTKPDMPTARSGECAVTANNGRIYVIGGYNGVIQNTQDEYTPPDWGLKDITDNPEWLDSTHFKASYDFTSLIPRGDYLPSVSEATGEDNIRITPFTGPTFQVDYAGYISVSTPPNTPLVSAWGDGSLTTLSAHWTATDPHAAITGYRYAIGTTSGGVDVVNWTNVNGTSLTRSGLNLTQGYRYFVSIKARNEGGLWSLTGTSNGVIAGMVAAPTLESISPTEVSVGSGTFTLTANGSNFTSASVIRWNGSDLVSTFISATQITAWVDATRLTAVAKVNIIAFTPGLGGGASAQIVLEIKPIKQFIPIIRKTN